MSTYKSIDNDLISKINKLLDKFEDYEQAFLKKNEDIIIKKKRTNDVSILTNIFKEIIKNDLKKNRV